MIACLAAISSIAWEPLAPRSTLRDVRVHNLWRQRIPYADALAWQRQLRSAHIGSHTLKVPAIIKRERKEEGRKEGGRKRRREEREGGREGGKRERAAYNVYYRALWGAFAVAK